MEKNVVKNLNNYLADLVVEYLKLHDLHWNVVGKQFVEVHKYTEGLYDQMAEKFDEVAERIIMEGAKPVSSIKEYLSLASVKELDAHEYRDGEVLVEVLNDLKHLREEALKLRVEADNEGVIAVANMLDGHVEGYDKEIWFLSAMLK